MILEVIDNLVYMFIIMLISIVFHEAGHYYMLKRFTGGKPKFRRKGNTIILGNKKDYQGLTKGEYKRVMVAGILAGSLPLVLFLKGWLLGVAGAYYIIYGCRADIDNVLLYNKKIKDLNNE